MGGGAAPGCSLATSGGGWNKTNTTIRIRELRKSEALKPVFQKKDSHQSKIMYILPVLLCN